MKRRYYIWLLLLPTVMLLTVDIIEARAGGGGSFGGGGSSGGGSSGGGGDGGAIVYLLIRLLMVLWNAGPIGKVMCFVIIGAIIYGGIRHHKKKEKQQARQEASGHLLHSKRTQRKQSRGVNQIKMFDPNFSRVLFLDFAHLIYVKLHESRGGLGRRGNEFAVSPYLKESLRQRIKESNTVVTEVIVGAVRIENVVITDRSIQIVVVYRSNVVEGSDKNNQQRYFMDQVLTFRRSKELTTQKPEKVMELGCPNCGSPEEPDVDGRCPSCGSLTGHGEMDWQVIQITTRSKRQVGDPVGIDGGIEVGTNLPTVYAPDLNARKRDLAMRDPAFQWLTLKTRIEHMFHSIQQGWTEVDESKLRPFETDTVFDSHRYWLERYKEEGKRNVLKDIKIDHIDIAKIEHDAWYDSITVRIFANMIDYNTDAKGNKLNGSETKPRSFSEYWTLIRRADTEVKPTGDPAKCPNCGAPLDKINRAGVCEYCGSKIISGEFDWVLAMITQDEEYAG
ncbi:MAG: TIM44-like domain-containing protein [Planctomycetes bacterium]|nr:TIM44-like domain-containing protein [Planctomycetota bacterium]